MSCLLVGSADLVSATFWNQDREAGKPQVLWLTHTPDSLSRNAWMVCSDKENKRT